MQDALEAMDEVVADRTIDEFMRRHPSKITRQDYEQLILAMRAKRALFIAADMKKKEK